MGKESSNLRSCLAESGGEHVGMGVLGAGPYVLFALPGTGHHTPVWTGRAHLYPLIQV